jgi:hypothetical protein
MIDLEQRLVELGDRLELPDDDLSPTVLSGIDASRRPRSPRFVWVAAALIAVVGVTILVPDARRTVAGWLGLDRVEVKREPLDPPDVTPTVPTVPDAAGGSAVTVDDRTVFVTTIDGRLNDAFITKTVGGDAPVVSLTIDGMPALWIEAPHELVIERDGEPVVERIAGSTLLWQDGDVLRRVEGFSKQADAVAYARTTL